MEENKLELIREVINENISLTSETIPQIFDKIREVGLMLDIEFDSDPELGREAKIKRLSSLQYQLGYLAALQSESLKFINMLDSDIEMLKNWVESTRNDNTILEEEIQKNLNGEIPSE